MLDICIKKYAEQGNLNGLKMGSWLCLCFKHRSHIFLHVYNTLQFIKLPTTCMLDMADLACLGSSYVTVLAEAVLRSI